MQVTFVHADKPHEWNSAHFRCVLPYQAINRHTLHRANLLSMRAFAENAYEAEATIADSDVVVLQRGVMAEAWPAVRRWQRAGKKLIADIDDGYMQVPPSHPAYPFWAHGRIMVDGKLQQLPRPAILDMQDGLELIGAMTSPSRVIMQDWHERIKLRLAHVPNYLDLDHYHVTRTRSPETDGTVWVGWGGSAGHFSSFLESGVSDALCQVLAARPHTRFVMCGADTRILDRIPLKRYQKLHFVWRHFAAWPALLANFDVGLIPLGGEFDERRSWLKPLEYSAVGVPWIATQSKAYEAVQQYGVCIDNTVEAWREALISAIDGGLQPKPDAKAWAHSQGIQDNINQIIDTYERL